MHAVTNLSSAVKSLRHAEATQTARGQITDEWPELDLQTAYKIQAAGIDERINGGETVVGIKLGLTSRAKQERMGVDSPLTATLTDAHLLPSGAPVPFSKLIHPRAEPEIAFVLGRTLRGPGITPAQALAAVEFVYGGIEIIDSRYANYQFTLPDVVADNASSAFFTVGTVAKRPTDLDLGLEAVALSVNGEVVDTATGAAVQGNPAAALALAANSLAQRGQEIPQGTLVLTGGLTDAVPLSPHVGISAEFSSLGVIHLGVE